MAEPRAEQAEGEKRSPTEDPTTPLHLALQHDNIDIVHLLLEEGADVNAEDLFGATPLHRCNSVDMAKLLIEKGADIHAVDENGVTPLHWCNSVDMAKLLIEKGADIHAVDESSVTPLHWCISVDMAKLLIEKGADIHAVDEDGRTPLWWATMLDREDMVKLLIEKGANVNVVDHTGETPLHECSSVDVAKLLLEKGADIHAVSLGQKTTLHYAARYGNEDVVMLLLEKGLDVNVVDKDGETPLHCALRHGSDDDMVKLLIEKGANVNVMDHEGNTPFKLAVEMGRSGVVSYLVKEHRVDTSQYDEETRKKIDDLLKEATNKEVVNFPDDLGDSHNNTGSNSLEGHSDSADRTSSHDDDPLSIVDTREEQDHLTIEDVNKGYMDGELLGPDVRVALLGAEGSGKTCLSHTLVGKDFQNTPPTEGADHMNIVVQSTTNWQPLTDIEKLRDLDKLKYLESMSSATRLVKSQPASAVMPVTRNIPSTMSLYNLSVVSTENVVSSSTTPIYSTHASYFGPSTVYSSAITYDPVLSMINVNPSVSGANSNSSLAFLSTASSSSRLRSGAALDTSATPAKKQKLFAKANIVNLLNTKNLSIEKLLELKAFRESYDPKKKYINIWDFAGQAVFQHTHGVFVSEEVVCLIVFDASLELDQVPECRYRDDHTPRRTVLQTICYWMELISSRVSKPSTSNKDLSLHLPTFILVGTHTDKLAYDIYIARDVAFTKFRPIFKSELTGKPFSKHIAGSKHNNLFEEGSPSLYFVCNKLVARDSVVINALKQSVIQSASITRQTRPTRYVEVERKLMLLSTKENVYVIGMAELAKVAESCGLPSDNEELLRLTQYFHHKGVLLHYHNVPSLADTIILSPHWMAKLLTYVLTSLTCLPTDLPLKAYAVKRQKKGLLEEELIDWSVEQFNKSQAVDNRIATDLRGVPVVDLFIKFLLIVDITQSSLASKKSRGLENRLFLVPHLLPYEELPPSKDASLKFLFYFPGHFIPDNLVDQLIVKCTRWNNDRHYDLLRLSYQWVCLNLGKYQVYEVKPVDQHHYIELTIIPDPAMPPGYEVKSYKESRELITAVKEFIDDLMKEHMTAIVEEFSVECFIPCTCCDECHIKLETIASTGRCYCPIKRVYCDLSRYCKILSTKGSPNQSTQDSTIQQVTKFTTTHNETLGGACSMALKKITEEYEKLANISVSNLLPNLVTKQVITHHEKQIIETKLLDSDKMMFLLDHVIVPSLRVDVCVKYNSFLEVMEKSSDILARGLAKRLGGPIQSSEGNIFEQVRSPPTPDMQKPNMRGLIKIVIPKIAFMWKTVADFLDYDIGTIENIEHKYGHKHEDDSEDCMNGLFRDWLSTNHGVKPKTWATLLKRLREIDQLATATSDIEKELENLEILNS